MLTFVLAYQKLLSGPFWIRARSVAEKLIENDKSYKKEHQFFLFVQIIQKLLLVAVNMFFTR
ncbi:hypothetical protein BKA69DRAFT_1081397 [Paraphysoderma sedebokerense]|nr:hypothetical protein BKA69DRAFT_1081397 [Paraphysoderma sedebokerense]